VSVAIALLRRARAHAQLLVGPVWLLLRKSLAALALPRLNCSASCRPRLAFATQKFGSASAAYAQLLSFAEQEQEQEQEQAPGRVAVLSVAEQP